MIWYENSSWQLSLLIKYKGTVLHYAAVAATFSGVCAVCLLHLADTYPDFNQSSGIGNLDAGPLWSAATASLLFLIGFRTNKAYSRFWDATTLLHQMWGEWFDAVSCLVAFSSLAKRDKSDAVDQFRHTLIRLMSLLHGSAMEEISQTECDGGVFPCLDVAGLDQTTLKFLNRCHASKDLPFNKVEVIIHMIQTLIVHNQNNGVLKIPPPILSRVFQTLSRGQVNLMNCKKITITLFPFPYAQLIALLLILFSFCTPVAMASLNASMDHGAKAWAFLYSFVPVCALYALNQAACELELPFGLDNNDLPLEDFQSHMNNSMLMLTRAEVDHVPHVHEGAAVEHDNIKSRIAKNKTGALVHDQSPTEDMFLPASPIIEASYPIPVSMQSDEHHKPHLHRSETHSALMQQKMLEKMTHVAEKLDQNRQSQQSQTPQSQAPQSQEALQSQAPQSQEGPSKQVEPETLAELNRKFEELTTSTSQLSRHMLNFGSYLQHQVEQGTGLASNFKAQSVPSPPAFCGSLLCKNPLQDSPTPSSIRESGWEKLNATPINL